MKNLLLPVLLSVSVAAAGRADQLYHPLKEIPVGGAGAWDYLSVDSAAKRLYVSHGTVVVVIDLAADKVAGEIPGTGGVHGLAPAPELGRGMATIRCRENMAAIVDLKSLKILSKVPTGQNPDGMLYEPGRGEFYTFNGRGESATVIDAKTARVVATIPLGGKPEFPQADPAGAGFDNLEDKSEVVAIDTKTHKVVNRWPIAPGEEASGMAIDTQHHRLFLGCGNKMMAMLDSTSGKVLATVPIGNGVDANAFDPGTQLAFASCGDGTTTIAREDGDKLTVVQTLKTEPGARTIALDPATHRIYLGSAKFEAPAAGQRRGKMVPDSFKILVYGLNGPAK